MVKNIIFMFVFLLAYKFLKNLFNLYKVKKIEKYFYTIYTDNPNPLVYETKSEIINLFKNAGVKDAFIPVTQPVGYGKLAAFNASTFECYPNAFNIFAASQTQMFSNAIGVYKKRMYETFNPLYWIETLIFLPKTLFQYLGFNTETIFLKIINLLYWLFAFLLGLFQDDIKSFLISKFPENFFNF